MAVLELNIKVSKQLECNWHRLALDLQHWSDCLHLLITKSFFHNDKGPQSLTDHELEILFRLISADAQIIST